MGKGRHGRLQLKKLREWRHCSLCKRDFGTEYALLNHLKSVKMHKGTGVLCRNCGVCSVSSHEDEIHQLKEHGKHLPYVCPTCEVGYRYEHTYLLHIEYHKSNMI